MNIKQLKKLVAQGECETIEFKRTTGQRTEAMKTVCAMLNGNGGYVIFGVTDNGEIKGQQVSAKTLKEIAGEMTYLEPRITLDIKEIPLDSEYSIIVITVPKTSNNPFVYDGRPYLRSGSTTSIMPVAMYERLLMERTQPTMRWEKQFALEVSISDLDEEEIHLTVDNAVQLGRLDSQKSRNTASILTKLGLMENGKLFNAAVVLYVKNEELASIFPQCGIRLARFRGTDKLANFSDNRQYWGHVFSLLRHGETFLMDNVPIASRYIPGKIQRQDRPLYPPLATREAIVNAICHREYTQWSSTIGIAMFDDHLEISNPGTLHFGLTPNDLLVSHVSKPWNPLIASVLYRSGIIEQWGTGTNKIIDYCREIEAPTPTWIAEKLDTFVIFYPAKQFPESSPDKYKSSKYPDSDLVSDLVSDQVKKMILEFCLVSRKANEIIELLNLKHKTNFQKNYLKPLLHEELLAPTILNKPQSRLQKYMITEKGLNWLKNNSK